MIFILKDIIRIIYFPRGTLLLNNLTNVLSNQSSSLILQSPLHYLISWNANVRSSFFPKGEKKMPYLNITF